MNYVPGVLLILVLTGTAAQRERLFCALRLGLPQRAADALSVDEGGRVRARRRLPAGRASERLGVVLAEPRRVEVSLIAEGARELSFPSAPGRTLLGGEDGQVFVVEGPLGTQVTTLAHELLTHVYLDVAGRAAEHRSVDDEVDRDARASEDEALRALRRHRVFTAHQRADAKRAWKSARTRLLAEVPPEGREKVERMFEERFPVEAFLEGSCPR